LFGLVKKKRVAFIDLIEMHIEGSKLARESYRSSQRERERASLMFITELFQRTIKKFITDRKRGVGKWKIKQRETKPKPCAIYEEASSWALKGP
jgi:hypothetical protein